MNAEVVPGVARPPRPSDYESIVRGLRPFIDGEELILRSSLLLMRDQAMATKARACTPSWALLDVIENIASECALNHRVSVDDLRELRRLCVGVARSARDFDMLYQPRLPLDEGEADAARG